MKRMKFRSLVCFTALWFFGVALPPNALGEEARSGHCDQYSELKRPLFGDLHVHTSYSHDAYVSMQRNTPWDAYRYAKGEPIMQPDENGEQTVVAQISTPRVLFGVMSSLIPLNVLFTMRVCSKIPVVAGVRIIVSQSV